MIVVDTNVVAYLLLPGPMTTHAEALLLHHPEWAAPPLWRSELRNVLTAYLRRDRLKLPEAVALMEKAEALLYAHDEPVSSEHVVHLVSDSPCSAYDCEFVAAAQQLGVPWSQRIEQSSPPSPTWRTPSRNKRSSFWPCRDRAALADQVKASIHADVGADAITAADPRALAAHPLSSGLAFRTLTSEP